MMKKYMLTIGLALLISLWIAMAYPSVLNLFLSANAQVNHLGVVYAKESNPQLIGTPIAGLNDKQINLEKNSEHSQINNWLLDSNTMKEIGYAPQSGQPQLVATRTPRPIEVKQTQDSIVMTQTRLAAQNEVQPASLDDFTGAFIYSFGAISGKQYLITIQLPAEVKGKYYARMWDKWIDANFKCSTTKTYPNRLYCNGKSVRGGERSIYVYELGTDRLVFIGDIVLPRWTPTFLKPSPCPCCDRCR